MPAGSRVESGQFILTAYFSHVQAACQKCRVLICRFFQAASHQTFLSSLCAYLEADLGFTHGDPRAQIIFLFTQVVMDDLGCADQ